MEKDLYSSEFIVSLGESRTMKNEILVGKKCILKYQNDFALVGRVLETGECGVIFETSQKVSFINWSEVKTITEMGE